MAQTIIGRGAEAILIRENNQLIKRRIPKSYRLPILDEKLRKQRTKKESKLLEKAAKIIPVPKILKTNEKTKEIDMQFIEGRKLSEDLDLLSNNKEICRMIGNNIAKLHDSNIIHGDLTTSNMIYAKDNKAQPNNSSKDKPLNKNVSNKVQQVNDNPSALEDNKVYFIDFGLGFESNKIEDKAVDLHLIKQALEAKHFRFYKEFFNAILEGYQSSKNAHAVIKRLEAVEKRGRYKQAY